MDTITGTFGTQAKLADNGKRFVASLIDAMIGGIISSIIFTPIIIMFVFMMIPVGINGDEDNLVFLIPLFFCLVIFIILIAFGLQFLLYVYYPAKNNGQTFGKKAMSIKVVDEALQVPTLTKFLVRFIVTFALNQFIPVLHYLTILFTDKRQGIHDMAAQTYVVEA